MEMVKVYKRVLTVTFEPIEIDQAEMLTQVQAAAEIGRSVQDISTALRTGRISGVVYVNRDDIRQSIYIKREDVDKLKLAVVASKK